MLKWNWFRRLIAYIRNTFVTDCPRCHRYFFGFHPYKEQIKIGEIHYRYVCHRCVPKIEG